MNVKREIVKPFDYNERNFRIRKFDAMTGSYIAFKLMSEIIPVVGLGKELGIEPSAGAKMMSKKDFFELQSDCLKICDELLEAGPIPVMNEDGSWGVIGLEKDTKTVLALSIQALMFNVKDFFDGSLLTSLAGALNLSPPDAKTLMNSSIPQS